MRPGAESRPALAGCRLRLRCRAAQQQLEQLRRRLASARNAARRARVIVERAAQDDLDTGSGRGGEQSLREFAAPDAESGAGRKATFERDRAVDESHAVERSRSEPIRAHPERLQRAHAGGPAGQFPRGSCQVALYRPSICR